MSNAAPSQPVPWPSELSSLRGPANASRAASPAVVLLAARLVQTLLRKRGCNYRQVHKLLGMVHEGLLTLTDLERLSRGNVTLAFWLSDDPRREMLGPHLAELAGLPDERPVIQTMTAAKETQ